MAQIARWKCLRGKNPQVRQFFLTSLGHVYMLTDLMTIEKTLMSIMVVALSEHVGSEYASQSYLENVDNVIRGIPEVDDDYTHNDDEDTEELAHQRATIFEGPICNQNPWIDWAKKIYDNAEAVANETRNKKLSNVNPFNIPKASKMLKEIMYYLPLWTGIMYPPISLDIEIRSSAAVEGQFSKIKNTAFDPVPLRVDKFVLLHLEWLVGELIPAAPKMLLYKNSLVDSINGSSLKNREEQVIDSLNDEENWGNKTKQKT